MPHSDERIRNYHPKTTVTSVEDIISKKVLRPACSSHEPLRMRRESRVSCQSHSCSFKSFHGSLGFLGLSFVQIVFI
uniref:Uncharacterized protein n=1 Tax=Panagrolaimus sp. JU765 TaxID=591449 RepID=A0AC34QRF5_9BILA